ncbi:MAG: AAA family ATPase [Candidatus Omnitrophica bacterium]|nr:AAA family ATPase [Candidatus Omnitrophota bacterium]
MKIAFAGKGGTGKTTLSALFIRTLADEKRDVLAVDCDPDSNLGTALGFADAHKITPIIEMEELIRKRMGVSEDGTLFKLNPKIDDIPDKFSKAKGNIRLIVMGAIKKGGSGCACPENAFVKSLMGHLVLRSNEDVVMDMEAGLEHFGRGTAESCDSVLIVVEPSFKSISSAIRINRLAKDLKMKNCFVIANKVRLKEDLSFIKEKLGKGLEVIEEIPFSKDILLSDKVGDITKINGGLLDKMRRCRSFLSKQVGR